MWRRGHKLRALAPALPVALMLLGRPALLHGAEQQAPPAFENALLSIRLSPRSPQQVAAFYEARGFTRSALKLLQTGCFVTVGIHNRSNTVLWLELDNWRFFTEHSELRRLGRAYWNDRWQSLALSQASRSTFGWTLLPESRDLQPDEPVGGNITLPQTDRPFSVEVRFATGARKQGEPQLVRIDRVRCARETPP